MKVVLIYEAGEEYEPDTRIEEFDSEEEMIAYVNNAKIGDCIISAYGFHKKIEIEPFEKVINYKIKKP